MNTIAKAEREKIYTYAQALIIAAGGPDHPDLDVSQIEAQLQAKFSISADRAGTARAVGQMQERGRRKLGKEKADEEKGMETSRFSFFGDPPPFEAICSCGKSALFVWASAYNHYVSESDGWVLDDFGRGSCGKDGHQMDIAISGKALESRPTLALFSLMGFNVGYDDH